MAFLLLAVTVFFPACGNTSAPDTITSSVLNQYYVNVDLSQAKKLTDGLATSKVEQEETPHNLKQPESACLQAFDNSRIFSEIRYSRVAPCSCPS